MARGSLLRCYETEDVGEAAAAGSGEGWSRLAIGVIPPSEGEGEGVLILLQNDDKHEPGRL